MNPRTLITASALTLTAGLLIAGPLSPPAGPVVSSYKTLSEIEPRTPLSAATTPGDANTFYKITQSGSYYLTGPIDTTGKSGIVITASHVAVDLGGFSITVNGTGQTSGIHIAQMMEGVTIRNGSVASLPYYGILAAGSVGSRLESLTVSNCGTTGIWAGARAVITGCTANNNADNGFIVESHAVISACHAPANGADGFGVSNNCILTDCSADGNTDDGFVLNTGTIAERRTARSNGNDGFESYGRTTIANCTSLFNAFAGFRPNGTGTLRHCSAQGNAVGIRSEAGSGLQIIENECSDNTSFGLWMNGATGCRIDGNHFYSNGGNGIYLNANGAHLVVRNTARANTGGNYNLDSASDYGLILTNPGNNFASSSPWANFSY